jgi:hypothetical protein
MVYDYVDLFTSKGYVKNIQVVAHLSMRSAKITMEIRGTPE